MRALDVTAARVVSVGRLARYLKAKLERDPQLGLLGVEGEVSNLRRQPNGAAYFALKDREALLECVGWPASAGGFPPFENGTAVVAYGAVTTYGGRSVYQLDVKSIELAGLGRLFQRYEERKARLAAEGLFAPSRKRALPPYPFRVALVGSRSGEGTRDFLTQASRRAPQVEIVVVETPVQGDAAAPEIVRAIERAGRLAVDLVVVARGGGSFEDLFVFSDERVVRAFAASPVPTVSAIGHEGDVPLSDLVADRRAATPSTAAQTVLPARDDLRRAVTAHAAALRRAQGARLERLRRALDRVEHRTPLADPDRLLHARRQRVDAFAGTLGRVLERLVARRRPRLVALERRLAAAAPHARLAARRERLRALARRLDVDAPRAVKRAAQRLGAVAERLPRAAGARIERRRGAFAALAAALERNNLAARLQQGYAILTTASGAIVRDPAQAPPGTRVRARVAHGSLSARVERDGPDGGEQIGLF